MSYRHDTTRAKARFAVRRADYARRMRVAREVFAVTCHCCGSTDRLDYMTLCLTYKKYTCDACLPICPCQCGIDDIARSVVEGQ